MKASNGHARFTVSLRIHETEKKLKSHETEIFSVVIINDMEVAKLLQESTAISEGINGLEVFLDHFKRQEILRLLDYDY